MNNLSTYWNELAAIPALTAEAEAALSLKAQQGSKRAASTLVTANLRYVVALARSIAGSDEQHMADLISEGNIALIGAAPKWCPTEAAPRFIQYAGPIVKQAMARAHARRHDPQRAIRADAPMHQGQTNTRGDMLRAPRPETDEPANQHQQSYAITTAIGSLTPREQIIVSRFYGFDGKGHTPMADIAADMNLTRERVRQIRKTAERKMRRELKAVND